MMNPTMVATDTPMALHARSPAKINLALQVLGKRNDGFHEIRSIVTTFDLTDHLTFRRADDGSIALTCTSPDLTTDESNLVIQAANALREVADINASAAITLDKRIPIAAGLGGGSGNAAATLAALNKLWQTNLSDDVLARIGADLGSDVPLFFNLPSAEIRGRGEIVSPINLRWQGWAVLAFAGCHVSTPAVYSQLQRDDYPPVDERVFDAIATAEKANELQALCFNHLEPAVFRVAPKVADMCREVGKLAGRDVRVTGAGQTAYLLFDEKGEAEDLRHRLLTSGKGIEACVVTMHRDSELT